jgi:hypothetical protein
VDHADLLVIVHGQEDVYILGESRNFRAQMHAELKSILTL